MKRAELMFVGLVASVLLAAPVVATESGTALRATEIKAAPFRDAKPTAGLASGDKVEILKRQGGWYQIKSAKGSGWVRMLSIRRGDPRRTGVAAGELIGLASGRAGTGKVVATTGIRGLNEEDLKEAKYNESEVKKTESLAVSQDEARKFAAEAKLTAQKLDYLSNPD